MRTTCCGWVWHVQKVARFALILAGEARDSAMNPKPIFYLRTESMNAK